ncbi:MAG: hypothetical protein V4541_02225 [Bacteroidota bacterium]
MKRYQSLIGLLPVVLLACQNNTNKSVLIDAKVDQHCYVYSNNKDSASLTVTTNGPNISGKLAYYLFEKDSNTGTIKGELRGDTLIADYTFNSEGIESVRQVVFLKKEGKLLSGFGEVVEKDGVTRFKDLSKLTFDNLLQFTPTACKY